MGAIEVELDIAEIQIQLAHVNLAWVDLNARSIECWHVGQVDIGPRQIHAAREVGVREACGQCAFVKRERALQLFAVNCEQARHIESIAIFRFVFFFGERFACNHIGCGICLLVFYDLFVARLINEVVDQIVRVIQAR